MASSGEDVEQLLSSRTATPIAQLNPDLTDQPTRNIHGEITITWPYSSVSKTFAFLLAEPDFRLRRNKGLVRIQLKGPSAEAVGKWELGSGDEVTVALDGAEWARDDEPARPAGSRSEWQLKFAGKLMLKATLGESQEAKFVNIDQPVPIEPPEAPNPIPFAEIDLTIFEGPPAVEKSPAALAPSIDDEYASPMFMKRSRASYGPLFELDLDDELEDDGGRKGKGRKRPRYSALNGLWKLNEDNDSPEPEPSAEEEQDGDVEMHDTPSRPGMADGGVQTNESDLAPIPSSPDNTPSKTWGGFGTWASSNVGMSRPHDASRTDSGIQASPSGPPVPSPPDHREKSITQTAPNPFSPASQSFGFAGFKYPQGVQQNQGFGDTSSLFGTTSTASSNQRFGHAPSLAGTVANETSDQEFGQPSTPFGNASNIQATQGLGQASSLFGMGSAPAQPPFPPVANANAGLGFASGSLRFGFGQEPQSTFGTSTFGNAQATMPTPADPYPEFTLDQQERSDHLPDASQNPFGTEIESSFGRHGEQTAPKDTTLEQDVSLWPMGTQTFDSSHSVGHINASEDIRTDGSDAERTPPGVIPPAVEDGTRNLDEMSQQGLLSRPVYRQGVLQEALPDQEDASAGEEDDSMDSDEYDAAEKGADYDLRNYDRVSDDEEGFEDEEPLSDEELLDEGSEHWAGAEADYEEDDYDEVEEDEEEGNAYFQAPQLLTQSQLPPQPAAQKEKVVIDLLSDSDDDETPAPPVEAPSSRIPLLEGPSFPQDDFADSYENELINKHNGRVAQTGPVSPLHNSNSQIFRADQEGTDSDEEAKGFDDDNDEFSDEQHYEDDDEAEPESELMESDQEEGVETQNQEAIAINDTSETHRQPLSLNGTMDVDDDRQDSLDDEGDDETDPKETTTANAPSEGDHQPDGDGADNVMATEGIQQDSLAGQEDDESEPKETAVTHAPNEEDRQRNGDGGDNVMDVDDDHRDNPAGSFQTQSDEVLASFHFHVTGALNHSQSPESHETSDVGMEDAIGQEKPNLEGNEEPHRSVLGSDGAEEDIEKDGNDEQLIRGDVEPLNVDSENQSLKATAEKVIEMETQETSQAETPLKQQDESPSSPVLQHQDPDASVAEVSITTVNSQIETQASDQQVTFETQETEVKAELVSSQPVQMEVGLGKDADRESAEEEEDVEMANAGLASKNEDMEQADIPQPPLEQDVEQADIPQPPLEQDAETADIPQPPLEQNKERGDEVQDSPPLEVVPKPSAEEIDSLAPPQVTANEQFDQSSHGSRRRIFAESQPARSEDGEDSRSTPGMNEQVDTSPDTRHDDSFVSLQSQVSEAHDAEEAETGHAEKSKRGGRKTRMTSSPKSAKPASASQKAQRQSSRQSSRQISAQQALSSQRTTRSKTMSFQAASPKDDKEDMSIQLARAALKSPTSKQRKVSATAAKRLNTDLVSQLENDLPDCVPLNDLRKYNANFVDVAVVATSANVPPKRTPTREYASSFTITDPSVAADGVVEVELYSLHKDHLPVVKTGDSILLRGFLVVSLPGRGFGLKTKDGSAWAVFKGGGGDEPEMKAAPVEMNDEETKFMLGLRAWYAGLDDMTKGRLAEAVGEMVEGGKESRVRK